MSDLQIMGDGEDIFIIRDGVTIAKRGHPDTLQARTWVSLEPGYAAYGPDAEGMLTVEYKGQRLA
jgi:hypothetical protein